MEFVKRAYGRIKALFTRGAMEREIDEEFFRKLSVDKPDQLVFFAWASRNWSPRDFTGSMNFEDGSGAKESRRSSTYFASVVLDRFRAMSGTLSDVFGLTFDREMSVI